MALCFLPIIKVLIKESELNSFRSPPGEGGGVVLGSIFVGYVPLASQNPYYSEENGQLFLKTCFGMLMPSSV